MNTSNIPNTWGLHIIIAFIIFQPAGSIGQPTFQWDRTYGGSGWEELQAIWPLPNGDIIMGGATFSDADGDVSQPPCNIYDKGDFWLVRLDIYGNIIWERRYGGDGLDRIWDIIPTRDGGFLLGGDSNSKASCQKSEDSRGGDDYWLIKTDSAGNIHWEKTYGSAGDDELHKLLELPDGGFFVLGFSDNTGGGDRTAPLRGSYDYWLLRLDSIGGLIWDKSYGGSGREQAYSLKPTTDGNFLLGGFSTSAPDGNKTAPHFGLNDFWILKIDIDGQILWDRSYGGSGEDVLLDIEVSNDGGFLLCGQSASPISGNKQSGNIGLRDYWIIKTDTDGIRVWDKTYGGTGYDDGFAIYQNQDGNILAGGVSASDAGGDKSENSRGGNDFWLIFLNEEGELLWDLTFGGDHIDALTEIIPVADGGILLGGHSSSSVSGDKTEENAGLNDFWIIKTACQLKLDLGSDTLICQREPLVLDALQPNCLDCKYLWNDGNTEARRTILPLVSRSYRLHISSRSGCQISDSLQIQVTDSPRKIFAQITPPRCPGESNGTIRLQQVEGGTPPYLYALADTEPLDLYGQYFNLEAGIYNLKIEDLNGCTLDTVIVLEDSKTLEFSINGGGVLQLGDTTLLQATVDPRLIDTFFWENTYALSCLQCLETTAQPLETTNYTLAVVNPQGCKFRASTTVAVEKNRPVYFPSVFSPNNDGINDYYRFYPGQDVEKILDFKIFSRWGALVYSERQQVPSEMAIGWDGLLNGRHMPADTYIYYATIRFIDGWQQQYEGSFILKR